MMSKSSVEPYKKRSVLVRLYKNQELTSEEIADKFDVSESTILRWLKRNNIDVRSRYNHLLKKPVPLRKGKRGYLYWEHKRGDERWYLYVHRLAAVAWFGYDTVKDHVVHHKNGYKLDNRESNLQIKTNEKHVSDHNRKLDYSDYGTIASEVNSGRSTVSVAEEYDLDSSHVSRIANGWRPTDGPIEGRRL